MKVTIIEGTPAEIKEVIPAIMAQGQHTQRGAPQQIVHPTHAVANSSEGPKQW
ncbi:hypothetical protein LJC49_06715 [Ruminococcaceae bacterium OttesenSCG-928-I18]|nr:hypothetical protein [Ruminococcaceae bacterium OttesenSCG-928-I18]